MSRDRLADPKYPDGDYRLSVLSYDKRRSRCPGCESSGVVFVCDGHAMDWPRNEQVRELCKPCALAAAGGAARLWVRTTFPKLREVWASGKRPAVSANAAAALAAHVRQRRIDKEHGQGSIPGASGGKEGSLEVGAGRASG